MYASYLFFPKIKPIYFFLGTFLIGIFITIADFMTLQMSTINEYGLVNRHINTNLLFINNLLIAITFLPSCMYVIYQSIKKGNIIRGILFGSGVAILSFFLPIILQTQDIFIYIFFNIGCIIGGALLALSLTVFSSRRFSTK
jgi:hypothetical protein